MAPSFSIPWSQQYTQEPWTPPISRPLGECPVAPPLPHLHAPPILTLDQDREL